MALISGDTYRLPLPGLITMEDVVSFELSVVLSVLPSKVNHSPALQEASVNSNDYVASVAECGMYRNTTVHVL